MVLPEEISFILNIAIDEDIHVYKNITSCTLRDGTIMSKHIEIRLDRLLSDPRPDQEKFKRISEQVYDRIKYLHPDAFYRIWPDYNPNVDKQYAMIKFRCIKFYSNTL